MPGRGTTTNESDEALTFRAMLKQARQVIAVADSSKLGVVTPSLICPVEDVDVLVTDQGAEEKVLAEFAERGVKVIRA
jgi:DeoR family transcriptional regulator, aga operon transcriptional repressor